MDYTLAVGSQAINFGNASTQPTDSLGSLGVDGFLVANGLTRTETNHNAGAYEYLISASLSLTRCIPGTGSLILGTGSFQ